MFLLLQTRKNIIFLKGTFSQKMTISFTSLHKFFISKNYFASKKNFQYKIRYLNF